MPMFDDKKKMATLIIGKIGKKEVEEAPTSEDGSEMDHEIGLKSASEEMIAAARREDADGFMSALKDFLSMYHEPKESQDQE